MSCQKLKLFSLLWTDFEASFAAGMYNTSAIATPRKYSDFVAAVSVERCGDFVALSHIVSNLYRSTAAGLNCILWYVLSSLCLDDQLDFPIYQLGPAFALDLEDRDTGQTHLYQSVDASFC